MKKTVTLTHPKIAYPRRVDAAKNEVRKYMKRERKRSLPEKADFWDFDCRFGDTEASAHTVHWSAICKHIDAVAERELSSFYVEILATPGRRAKGSATKPRPPAGAEGETCADGDME